MIASADFWAGFVDTGLVLSLCFLRYACATSAEFRVGLPAMKLQEHETRIGDRTASSAAVQAEQLYGGLRDRLFSAPGTWSLRECPEPACGLLWLDPEPSEDDIGLLYRKLLHARHTNRSRELAAARIRTAVGVLLKTTTVARDRQKLQHLFVDDFAAWRPPRGRLWRGGQARALRADGLAVTGQEVDPVAAAEAVRQSAAEVHVGP